MSEDRPAKPAAIHDFAADMKERSLKWKRPHLKPLDIMTAHADNKLVLTAGLVPALDNLNITTNYWTWNTINHGDCKMTNAVLWLSSDGTGRFAAYTITTDDGDVWLVQGLALLDNNGVELYRIPQFDGPRMSWADSYYPVDQNVLFPAYLFTSIRSIRMYHHC